MPDYLSPEIIWCLDLLPLTSAGKPDRPLIREIYTQSHAVGSSPVTGASVA